MRCAGDTDPFTFCRVLNVFASTSDRHKCEAPAFQTSRRRAPGFHGFAPGTRLGDAFLTHAVARSLEQVFHIVDPEGRQKWHLVAILLHVSFYLIRILQLLSEREFLALQAPDNL